MLFCLPFLGLCFPPGCHTALLRLHGNNCFAVRLWLIVRFRTPPGTSGTQSVTSFQDKVITFVVKAVVIVVSECLLNSVFPGAGGINRAGAAVPTFLRTPAMIQPHLDMKSFLQFPIETPPPPHTMSLFHNFNAVRTNKRINNQALACCSLLMLCLLAISHVLFPH